MKSIKKGFSLAEVLIALTIVSIIATLGFTIAKKGIEDAYNLYIYTAYSSMQKVIIDANKRGDGAENNYDKFVERIISTFSSEKDEDNSTASATRFKTSNNVQFEISKLGKYESVLDGREHSIISIKMILPSVRKASKENCTLSFVYRPQYPQEGLVPYTSLITEVNDINLNERRDLLPFYIDGNKNNTGSKKKKYYSYEDAYCRVIDSYANDNTYDSFSDIETISDKIKFNCNISDNEKTFGAIKVANPRKIF